jgi:pimeloyl-ACP methyl ester carboxylesterase
MQKIEAKQRRILLEERGLEIALLDWGGDGPLVLMHHANGFCAGTLGLVAEALVPAFRVIAMDARGHGDSSRPEGPNAYAWDHFALTISRSPSGSRRSTRAAASAWASDILSAGRRRSAPRRAGRISSNGSCSSIP